MPAWSCYFLLIMCFGNPKGTNKMPCLQILAAQSHQGVHTALSHKG